MFVRNGSPGPFLSLTVVWILLCSNGAVLGEILTPPYFNLAEGRAIQASATCGDEGPEQFCKLVGASSLKFQNFSVIQGQFCDVCDPSKPDKMHPPEFAVDGMETWWQSPPLSRGMKYNEVNLTIDLGQEFHVAYVFIRMGISPRPGLWVLEKSADYGLTYTPWQYFSDSAGDCWTYFGQDSNQPILRDDSVICSTEYSKIVPLEGGEIPISLLNNRPNATNYFNSSILQEWTRATNVRFRFLRTKNLLGHLMSVARQDPTVTRRYFYSIKDISIGGRCMCNGHADTCDNRDPNDLTILLCRCQHNTCGPKCDRCCPGYEQKAWRQSKSYSPFSCEPCNCFSHSRECVYDPDVDRQRLSLDIHGNYEGGGVCQNCQHNTEGINCNRCKARFYRPYHKHWNETDVCHPCNCDETFSTGNCEEGSGRCECRKEFTPPNCDSCSFGYYDYPRCKPCDCFLNGTHGLQCEAHDGQCPCKVNFGGKYCKECSPTYYKFPECKGCDCNSIGSVSQECDQQFGNCTCLNNYGGDKCDQCQHGYYNYPDCVYCNCDVKGTKEGICNKTTGQCWCKEGYSGDRCDQCTPGYYDYPDCKPCNCSSVGATTTVCDVKGKCPCLQNFAGRTCNQCSPGYYKFPECLACQCDSHGADGITCDGEGNCKCFSNFDGQRCEKCREGFYNFPVCEDCNCHPAGVVEGFAGCGSVPAGELCQCKDRVEGRICDKCKPLYWNLNVRNPDGCEDCNCNPAGVLGGVMVCDKDGQCPCKPSVVAKGCTLCEDGTYNLQKENLFGCTDCACDVGGSINPYCDKNTGQCYCQARVTGRTCTEPLKAHYFPTLYQYQYEIEDGRTPHYTAVRYSYDERDFPGFSWKGYAVFSVQQNEVLQEVHIAKPSVYIAVFRYVNKNPDPVVATVKVTPDNPSDIEQKLTVTFKNSSDPTSVLTESLVMNPGRWIFSIKVEGDLLIDYFVLLPEEFYLATILKQKIDNPCKVFEHGLCRDFHYPNISTYDMTLGAGGYIVLGTNAYAPLDQYYRDTEHLGLLDITTSIPLINNQQPVIDYELMVRKPGPYVIVLNYVTPRDDQRTHLIDVDVLATSNQTGKAELYSCPYTSLCRQVLTTPRGNVGVYNTDSNHMKFILKGNNANVGIHSIVAIPWSEWSLDFIRPKSVCIRRDGQCLKSTFPNPPESKKIQFEQEVEGAEGVGMPPVIKDNSTTYVYLGGTDRMIDLRGKVAYPDQNYMFVVHYYQPNFAAFDLDVLIQNGRYYNAKLPVSHCPSKSGCRSVVTPDSADGLGHFNLTENFVITHTLPDDTKNVYLDYVLVIPSDVFSSKILEEEEFDRASEFILTCGGNQFNIDTTRAGFCKDSVFSITAGYNNGALECQCDFEGSLSFECDKFGGQCKCKPNIIGRQCEACKTGYFGFPDCKPCNCPSTAICEANTGTCICPDYVTGPRCDQCMPETYGFHPIIGCEPCKCDPLGVNGSLQCDLFTGACSCKENIVGRTCDVCKPGYFSYPYCDICDCDTRGTLEEICDQISAECFCKKYVVGPQCNLCKEGSYNLQANNKDGCTECFCFGKTTRCSSSSLIRTAMFHMRNWRLVNIDIGDRLNVTDANLTLRNLDDYTIEAKLSNATLVNHTVYFAVPHLYLGKKLTSYGGYLKYNVFYTIGESGKALFGADVILEGASTFLIYKGFEQPANEQDFVGSLEIVETNFELPSGLPANREHIMTVLKDLRGLYIRAGYWSATYSTKLSNVFLDEAITAAGYHDPSKYSRAFSVEHCQCPPNYQGLSCEECAPGYYRVSTGPHGGSCIPCQCNGHADTCDVNTGICLNCQHNTKGEHCELCAIGYHGNALQGTPMDCLICACPLPLISNNFATGCDLSYDGTEINCECVEGYAGHKCQYCASGYYGKPDVPEEYCKQCQCNNNIDPMLPDSCDRITGDCLRCLNNTYGTACSICKPGYFGDAIQRKDCQPCLCDEVGTARCDSYTGQCICKPNVIGEKCDRCAFEHYGFETGSGCTACNCGLASESNQCDDSTGQCMCKPGVANRNCDKCKPGFWNYTADGCLACKCNKEYSLGVSCNPLTGQCECLNGVIGEKCDHCPYRWAFDRDYGCHQCDSCVHNLLDTADELARLIDPSIQDLDSIDSGFFTSRRLNHMNETFQQLKPRILALDPNATNLTSLTEELKRLEQDSQNMYRQTNYSLENSDLLVEEAKNLRNETAYVSEKVYDAVDKLEETINNIAQLASSLSTGEGPIIDAAINEANAILEELKKMNVSGPHDAVENEIDRVELLIMNLHVFKVKIDSQEEIINGMHEKLKDFDEKLDDLYNHTGYSMSKTNEAGNLILKNGKDRVKQKFEKILNYTREAENIVEKAKIDVNNGTRYYNQAKEAYENLAREANALQHPITYMQQAVDGIKEEIPLIDEIKLPEAQKHADNLTEQAQNLDNIFKETQGISENALKAVNAYLDIEKAIQEAYGAAKQSKEFIQNATAFYDGLNTEIADAIEASANASDSASYASQNVETLKPELYEAEVKSRRIRSLHQKNKEDLERIEDFIKKYPTLSYEDLLREAISNTEKASQQTEENKLALGNNYNKVPNQTEEAKLLPKKVDDTVRYAHQIENQLDLINDKLPKIISDLNAFPKGEGPAPALDLDEKIARLKRQISQARDLANRIEVGVRFYPNTTLELRKPDNLEELSTSNKISGYFRTNNSYGLLIYLGNANGTGLRRTKSDDYMALEIMNGYPVLTLDIGNDKEIILNTKFVADNNWYQFIIERTGLNAKLTILEELEDGRHKETVAESGLQSPFTIFNLDRNQSKLFVGGYPPEFNMQETITQNSFDGEMEGIVIGDTPVSLWNFDNGFENHRGARQRTKLVNLSPSTGCRFSGTGFVVIDARGYQHKFRNNIRLRFKTFAAEGLLFLYGNRTTYIALEMQDGNVLFKYNLGRGTKTFRTPLSYNDGEWHRVEAIRDGTEGRLVVDDQEITQQTGAIQGNAIGYSDYFYFGGYVKQHGYSDVTNKGFDGCIDNVDAGNPINLNSHYKAYDIIPGCPVKFARLVSFEKSDPGYIKLGNVHVNNDLTMAFKFKTNHENGLIFYLTNADQSSGISLSLQNGQLRLISEKIELIAKDQFNDSQWHVVSIMHNSKVLSLYFDDYGFTSTDSPPPPLHLLHGNLYIGGVPNRFSLKKGRVASSEAFSGCLGDATFNGTIINFANTTEKVGDILGTCVLDAKTKHEFDAVPELPPLPDLELYTTPPPQYPIEEGYRDEKPCRGDMAADCLAPGVTKVPTREEQTTPPEPEIDTTKFVEETTTKLPPTTTTEASTTTTSAPTTTTAKPTTPAVIPRIITPTTMATPEPPPSCALPMYITPPDDIAGPFYFGTVANSRIEYDHARGNFRKQFKFSLDIRTNESSGIIFYASDKTHTNFITLYMHEGQLIYKLKSNKDVYTLHSVKPFNDGEWHNVVFSRNQSQQELIVDEMMQEKSVTKTTGRIEVDELFMLGGVKEEYETGAYENTKTVDSFRGCVRKFHMNKKPMEKPRKFDVGDCPENQEEGNYFNGGYVVLKPKYVVGDEINIKMDIKPRNITGLILAVHGRRDYLILEMVNGAIRFTVENGRGPIVTVFSPDRTHYLCDGQWHTIQAVKSRNIVTLSVDNKNLEPEVGDHRSKSTDTGGALFLGSHRVINKLRGLTARVPFIGCIKNVHINTDPFIIHPNMRKGEVVVGQCPTN